MTLSVAIVAMDEEANIGRTLASVRWADEIVVVTPSLDRDRRIASFTALGDAWRSVG